MRLQTSLGKVFVGFFSRLPLWLDFKHNITNIPRNLVSQKRKAVNVTCGTLHRYRSTSPIYCIPVTLYFLQSSQNWLAENLARKTIVALV